MRAAAPYLLPIEIINALGPLAGIGGISPRNLNMRSAGMVRPRVPDWRNFRHPPISKTQQAMMDKYWVDELANHKPFWDAVHSGVGELLRKEGNVPSWDQPGGRDLRPSPSTIDPMARAMKYSELLGERPFVDWWNKEANLHPGISYLHPTPDQLAEWNALADQANHLYHRSKIPHDLQSQLLQSAPSTTPPAGRVSSKTSNPQATESALKNIRLQGTSPTSPAPSAPSSNWQANPQMMMNLVLDRIRRMAFFQPPEYSEVLGPINPENVNPIYPTRPRTFLPIPEDIPPTQPEPSPPPPQKRPGAEALERLKRDIQNRKSKE